MTNAGVLRVSEMQGIEIAVAEWTVSEQIIASAVHGMVGCVPADAKVSFTDVAGDDGRHSMLINMSGAFTMDTTIPHCNTSRFEFLYNLGDQKVSDVYHIMGTVINAYLALTVRGSN